MAYNVLIVDDDHMNRLLLSYIIEDFADSKLSLTIELAYADNGEKALEIFETFNPQLIFLDDRLPQLQGFDVCKIIRKKEKGKNIDIVRCSASLGEEKTSKMAKESGFSGHYLAKPFDLEKMSELLEMLIP